MNWYSYYKKQLYDTVIIWYSYSKIYDSIILRFIIQLLNKTVIIWYSYSKIYDSIEILIELEIYDTVIKWYSHSKIYDSIWNIDSIKYT